MNDLARLTKALAELDEDYPDWEWAAKAMTPAARLVVDGQDVSWCEVHEFTARLDQMTYCVWSDWLVAEGGSPAPCRLVPARLVFPKQGGDT